MPMEKMIVGIDDQWQHEAYVDLFHTWNGWLEPYFTFEEAQRVLEECVDDDGTDVDHYWYDQEEDTFYVFDRALSYVDNNGVQQNLLCYEGVELDSDDGRVRGYPIGAGEWIWSRAD